MKLHHHPVSPFARKAWVAMLHRGDEADYHVVDLGAGELGSERFLALNPFGRIPVLEAEDEVIFESTSIIEFLEARGPRCLLPRGTERLARHFDRLGDHYLIDAQAVMWFEPGTPRAERARRTAMQAWALLDDHLAERAFVAGRHFTLGDIGPAIATDYLQRLGEAPPEHVLAWKERCFDLPAMQTALEAALPAAEAMLARRPEPVR